jgi:hypothetical protein
LVLDMANGLYSLVASLSMVAELLEGCINAMTANGVCWGTWSVLVAALSHFLKLETELELLGSGCGAGLMEDQVDALWIQARPSSDSLASHVLLLVAHGPLDGAGE